MKHLKSNIDKQVTKLIYKDSIFRQLFIDSLVKQEKEKPKTIEEFRQIVIAKNKARMNK